MYTLVADKGLNLKHFPARGIFGMSLEKVFLHFHLQFVSLYTSSDLWLGSLGSQIVDFFWKNLNQNPTLGLNRVFLLTAGLRPARTTRKQGGPKKAKISFGVKSYLFKPTNGRD